MIPIPPPVCLGQKITVDGYNQLLDVMRQLQPISGPGILLEETLNGVVFRLADQPKTQTANAFDHPWKCTIAPVVTEGEDTKYTLTILKGSFYLIGETGAARQDLAISEDLSENTTHWTSSSRAFGTNVALSIVYHAENDAYRLAFDDVKEGETTLFTIATIHGNTQGDAPWVEQHLLEDIYYWKVAGVGERAPEPFEVRLIDDQWMIYAPTIQVVGCGLVDVFIDAGWEYYQPTGVKISGWVRVLKYLASVTAVPTNGKLYVNYAPQWGAYGFYLGTSPRSESGFYDIEIGSWSNGVWTQKRKGAMLHRVTVSPPCVVNEDTGSETLGQNIESYAIKSYIGRTYYIESLEMNGEILSGPGPVYKMDGNGGEMLICGKGMEVQFRNPLLANTETLFTQGSAMFPPAKLGESVVLAEKEEQKRLEGIAVETPTEEKQQGRLYSSERTSYVWVAHKSGTAVSTDLLYTEVEEANTLSVYSGA